MWWWNWGRVGEGKGQWRRNASAGSAVYAGKDDGAVSTGPRDPSWVGVVVVLAGGNRGSGVAHPERDATCRNCHKKGRSHACHSGAGPSQSHN